MLIKGYDTFGNAVKVIFKSKTSDCQHLVKIISKLFNKAHD